MHFNVFEVLSMHRPACRYKERLEFLTSSTNVGHIWRQSLAPHFVCVFAEPELALNEIDELVPEVALDVTVEPLLKMALNETIESVPEMTLNETIERVSSILKNKTKHISVTISI